MFYIYGTNTHWTHWTLIKGILINSNGPRTEPRGPPFNMTKRRRKASC